MPAVRAAPSSTEDDLIFVTRLSAKHEGSVSRAVAKATNPLIKAVRNGIVLKVVRDTLIVAIDLNGLDDPRFCDEGSESLQRLVASVARQDRQAA
jgi:hypothetical protein